MSLRESGEILPRPDRIHHIVEDFLTSFDAETTHILPLRRFLENLINADLRHFYGDDCILQALTESTLSTRCQHDINTGQLLSAPQLYKDLRPPIQR